MRKWLSGEKELLGTGLARRLAMVCLLAASVGCTTLAQQGTDSEGTASNSDLRLAKDPDDSLTTMFHHAEWDRWWVSGQANFISQYHPSFHSPYQGQNSLTPEAQDATSRVLTLYAGGAADEHDRNFFATCRRPAGTD